MATIEQLNLPAETPFDYQLLMSRLANYASPRDKVSSLLEKSEIIRVKKGLYIAKGAKSRISRMVLSGLVYGPSYVSAETALAHHGLIPERVEEITCMSTKRARTFQTPLGRFRYRAIPVRAFPVGVTLESEAGGSFYLATPEKALCDRVLQERGEELPIGSFLIENLRIEEPAVLSLAVPHLQEISDIYRRTSIRRLVQWIAEFQQAPSKTS